MKQASASGHEAATLQTGHPLGILGIASKTDEAEEQRRNEADEDRKGEVFAHALFSSLEGREDGISWEAVTSKFVAALTCSSREMRAFCSPFTRR